MTLNLLGLIELLAMMGVAVELALMARSLRARRRTIERARQETAYWRRRRDQIRRQIAWFQMLASTRPVWSRQGKHVRRHH